MKKKIILMLALFSAVVCANAQIATENSNALDNIGVGVTVGASTPLDFNSVFPLNPNVGLKVTKDVTPTLGFQLEGLAILNDNHFNDIKTAVKATNVGLNGVVNLTNLVNGYKGTPRTLELSTVTGLGWLHTWNTSVNNLSAKTGLDIALNLGKTKAHSFVLTPAVYWNLNKLDAIKFNKNGSQLALNLTYVYHLKTSNGTRHFKTYDVGAMMGQIEFLNGKLAECEARPPKEVIKEVIREVPAQRSTNAVRTILPRTVYVFFSQGSAELTDAAKEVLNTVNGSVQITATASPEGSAEFNKELSQRRADAVAEYLKSKNVTVVSQEGIGVTGDDSGRVAIVTSVRRQ